MKKNIQLIIIILLTFELLGCHFKDAEPSDPGKAELIFDSTHAITVTTTINDTFLTITGLFPNSYEVGREFDRVFQIEKCKIKNNNKIEFDGKTHINYYYDKGYLLIASIKNNTISGTFEIGTINGSFKNIPYKDSIASTPCIDDDSNLYYGNVVLYNQEDVDAFGAMRYKKIKGNLKIGCSGFEANTCRSNMYNLNSLEHLIEISESLQIYNADDISGLSNLKSVKNVLLMFFVAEYTEEMFNSLESINGYLHFENCYDLNILRGFKNLVSIDGDFVINNCRQLTTLQGFDNVKNLKGKIRIGLNKLLTDYCALSTFLKNYTGVVEIFDNGYNPTLEDLKNGNCSK